MEMTGLLEYAVESSFCLALLWVFHEIALKRDTQHRRNRTYLLGSIFFSVVVPLLNIQVQHSHLILPEGGLISFMLPEAVISPSGSVGLHEGYPALLQKIYLAGVIISAGIIILRSTGIIKLLLEGKREGRITVFDSDDQACFSALGHIFISGDITGDSAKRMISHERKHINLGHHTDLVIAVLISVLQWFNPFAYLMRRSLQAVHEYEADSECITEGENLRSYQELLLASVFRSRNPLLSNTFSKRSLLKNRIIMMTKKRTGSAASLKMILALPLAFALVFMFSCQGKSDAAKNVPAAETAVEAPQEVFTVVEVMPVFMNDTTHGELFKWVSENLDYPMEAKEKGIQGKVAVKFIIDEQGNVTSPEVVESADPLLDAAALELIAKCPQWSPGTQRGKPVKVYMTLPVTFKLK
ncbi:MAG: M56 family metallopeptidase [Bacteroidales bacterium]|jgi:TonB family protein|nr:M56 family metallopeptidase [Bacteroidales bacterium]